MFLVCSLHNSFLAQVLPSVAVNIAVATLLWTPVHIPH